MLSGRDWVLLTRPTDKRAAMAPRHDVCLPDFREGHEALSRQSFLRRGVTADEAAGVTACLPGERSGGMTGEIPQINGGLRHTREQAPLP
ncbi:hypothetical protein [Roseibium aggregatum]|uniref:Uncharacterized protein n=1 Tax=Roseibium aggregatum TaxID=187304 RepID=A0A939IZZ6_9HYPH|nr:hypothetical protein [Roseibium aggregatum]MBN9668728.1 hypothetical protein [Roseibium aggregatum]